MAAHARVALGGEKVDTVVCACLCLFPCDAIYILF
jgi:hypothetical protein